MVRQTTKVIVLEVLGAILLLLMAVVAVLVVMLSSGPVELGMFRDDIEQALTKSRNGRAVSVERLTLQWSPGERRLFVVASNVSLKDDQGVEAGRAARADITLDAGAIFLGDVEVLRLHLDEGWMNLQNTGPNHWSLAGDPLPEIKAESLPQTPKEWLIRTNLVLGDILNGLDAAQDSLNIEALTFDDMDVRYLSIDGNEVGRLENAAAALELSQTDITLTLEGEGGGLGLPGRFSISMATRENYGALRADMRVEDWPVTDLARRFNLSGLQDGGLTLDITVGSGVTRADGIQRIDISMERAEGTLSLPFADETLSALALDASYLIEADTVAINTLTVETDRLGGVFTGKFENVLSETEARRVELASDELRLDLSGIFPQAWRFDDFEFSADLSDDFTIITFDHAQARIDGATVHAAGELDWLVEHAEGEIPFSLDATAEVVGEVQIETVLAFWPEQLGARTRQFVVDRIQQGVGTEASASARLRPDSLAEGFLRDTDLLVNFSFKDGLVQFMSDLPLARDAVGTGRLTGNSFSVTANDVGYDDWTIEQVEVDFPVLRPAGQDFTVKASGSGPAVSILRQLSTSRLKLQERSGFDPERVSGLAEASLELTRPIRADATFSETSLAVKATIRQGGLKAVAGDMDLSEATVQVDLTQDRLILTGYGEVGQAPVQFTWRDALRTDDSPADLSATAIVTPDVLNAFGLVGRAYLTGEIPVEMQGKVSRGGLGQAAFAFDLRDARIDIGEIGWIKPAGEPARATLTYSGDAQKQASAVRLSSATAQLDGDVLLGADGRLETMTLREFYIEGKADVAGTLQRMDNGGVELSLTGVYLDISPFLSDFGAVGGTGDGLNLPLSIDATVDRLRLRRGLELSDATMALASSARALKTARAKGTTSAGARLEASYIADPAGGGAKVSLTTDDAGFLAKAFLDVDFISGGELDLTGTLAKGNQPTRLLAKVSDARLTNVPFFTQILSLASLRGLTDTLAGDGVMFTRIEAPILIGGGRYVIDGARASGPALGLTVNGWIGTDGKRIELDGVLVPSFGVNSLLGGVPVIGDLFVGRRGEGIFSITYSVRGSLKKAQVAVNPLSAVTPGILRRIFENPSDTSIPDALPVDPNLKPPTPKLPDLPDDEYIAPTPDGG